MVPVLSRSRVLMSPAASTARPLMASTLYWTRRSMPAMPMAESKPPMVVGIRQTSSDTRTKTVCGALEYMAKGWSVTTASKNTSVNPAITMFNAISFGVFCRSTPSTSAIMRSRNVSPGLEVIFTLIQSESTFVPPVTALRSPPDSRITGALSPVIADSSTLAIPSITSPSPGMVSPCSTRQMSPLRSCVAATVSNFPFTSRHAVVSVLVLRNVSACALPRPSAMASAKFANSTVNQSHSVIWKVKPTTPAPAAKSRTVRMVVITAPTSTTNMTGFFIMVRGFSLTNESPMARLTIGGSKSGRARGAFLGIKEVTSSAVEGGVIVVAILAPEPALMHQEMFHYRAERKRREERQSTYNHHHPHQQHDKQRPVRGESPGRNRHLLLLCQVPGRRQQRNQHQEPPAQHGDPNRGVKERSVRINARQRAAVIPDAAGVGIKHLRKAMRPVVAEVGGGRSWRIDPAILGKTRHRAVGGESQNSECQHHYRQHHHLDFLLLDLLAEVFGRSAHHQPGNEDRQDREQ